MKVIEMSKKLFKIVSDVFEINISDVDNTFSKDNYANWDSIMHLVLIAELEHEFDVTFSPESIENINSLLDIQEALNQ